MFHKGSALAALLMFVSPCAAFTPGAAPAVYIRSGARARATLPRCAGFGGGAAASSKKGKGGSGKPSSPKASWDRFKQLVIGGAERLPVFAGVQGDLSTEVGDVAVEAPGTAEQAAQANKRLILEHAPRVNLALQLRARELVVGLIAPDGVVVPLRKGVAVPEGMRSGFEGRPDASGKYSKVGVTTTSKDPTAIIGSAARD